MFTGKTKLSDLLNQDEKYKEILAGYNMFCEGCPGASNATLEEAAEAHDICLDEFLDKLNKEE